MIKVNIAVIWMGETCAQRGRLVGGKTIKMQLNKKKKQAPKGGGYDSWTDSKQARKLQDAQAEKLTS